MLARNTNIRYKRKIVVQEFSSSIVGIAKPKNDVLGNKLESGEARSAKSEGDGI